MTWRGHDWRYWVLVVVLGVFVGVPVAVAGRALWGDPIFDPGTAIAVAFGLLFWVGLWVIDPLGSPRFEPQRKTTSRVRRSSTHLIITTTTTVTVELPPRSGASDNAARGGEGI